MGGNHAYRERCPERGGDAEMREKRGVDVVMRNGDPVLDSGYSGYLDD